MRRWNDGLRTKNLDEREHHVASQTQQGGSVRPRATSLRLILIVLVVSTKQRSVHAPSSVDVAAVLAKLLSASLPSGAHTLAMLPSQALRARSAWKGPFFVAFPNLAEALRGNTPIRTNARSCTILPNYVG